MVNLPQLSQSAIALSLEAWVDWVNGLLPQFVPSDSDSSESISPRLVRYYVAEGLLDRPQRKGRGAFYGYRQLLQILLVRRLLAEGYGLGAIAPLLQDKANGELEALLQGGIQLTLEAANPALAFLQDLRRNPSKAPLSAAPGISSPGRSRSGRSKSDPAPPSLQPIAADRAASAPASALPSATPPAWEDPLSPAPTSPTAPSADCETCCETWQRFSLLPGLELHIHQGFPWPQTPQEQQNLLQRIIEPIQALLQRAKAKP